jgi:hypothetical protein
LRVGCCLVCSEYPCQIRAHELLPVWNPAADGYAAQECWCRSAQWLDSWSRGHVMTAVHAWLTHVFECAYGCFPDRYMTLSAMALMRLISMVAPFQHVPTAAGTTSRAQISRRKSVCCQVRCRLHCPALEYVPAYRWAGSACCIDCAVRPHISIV